MCDLAHVARWDPHNLHDLAQVLLGWICTTQILLDLYYSDPAQPLITAGEELDYVDHDLFDLSEVDHDLSDLSEVDHDLPDLSVRGRS